MEKRVLVVDDEQSIVTLLQYNLQQAGYEVLTAADGEEGRNIALEQELDLIILDLMLPKLDGIEVCKQLRQQKILTPILMLTAKDDEFDKVLGLELGADDYMTKPFSPREVIARVKDGRLRICLIVKWLATWIGFSGVAPRRAICRSSSQQRWNWSSTGRLPRHSASKIPQSLLLRADRVIE